jgi:putative intracellular protease/amidase
MALTPVGRTAPVTSTSAPTSKGKVLILLPENGGDPSETAMPYDELRRAGYEVVFATASGKMSQLDTLASKSVFLLPDRPNAEGRADTKRMLASKEFQKPITFDQAYQRDDFAALFVPGGEGKGMPAFLSNGRAHDLVRKFYAKNLPAAFLCHGALMAARTVDPKTGASVVRGERVTTISKTAEELAVPAFILSGRPRVYGALGGNWAADEMRRAAGKDMFVEPDFTLRFRPAADRVNVVRNGNHLFGSGPWDSKPFASAFVELLDSRRRGPALR